MRSTHHRTGRTVRAFCLTFVVSLSLAASAESAEYAGDFLNIGFGARGLALGDAMTAFARGPEAMHWNPAFLARSSHSEVLAMHSERFAGAVQTNNLGVVLPTDSGARSSGFGFGLVRVSVDDVPRTAGLDFFDHGEDGVPNTGDYGEGDGEWNPGERVIHDEGRIEYGSDSQMALLVAYGTGLTDYLDIGFSAKLIRQSVASLRSFGSGLDLGLNYRPSQRYSIGLRISDVGGTRIWWDSGRRERIRTAIAIGQSYGMSLPSLRGELSLSLDGHLSEIGASSLSGNGVLRFGAEYGFANTVFARLGMNDDRFAAGAGLALGELDADYAFIGHEDLGSTHRVSINWVVGR